MRGKKCTIRTFSETINQLCEYYNTTEVSYTLRRCVQDCILQQTLFPSTAFKETNTDDSKQVFKTSEIKLIKESYILSQTDLGITDKLVQTQLGHADISTTHRAYYYDIFDEEEKVNVLSKIRID